MSTVEVLERVSGLRTRRTPFVLATVVRAERPTSAKPGDCALVLPDGRIEGFVGGACAESSVRLAGLRLLETGESTLLRISPTAAESAPIEGMLTVDNPCASGGTLDIFLEAMVPPLLVHVFGEAPIARALVRIGTALEYDARGTTDPDAPIAPDTSAVVVASHGRDEVTVLATALRAGVQYVGLVASRRRGATVLAELDVPDALRAQVHSPAGLDIGARTPAEVALSTYADLIAHRPEPRRSPVPSPRAVPLAEAVDPVCGMSVAVSEQSLSVQHNEKTWYFCGAGCRQAFADDPGRYAG
jgi:xanthine dehydrogenase accessory factor